ncbi:hypothetical protein HK098_007130, partial [Nowakowskiella sp. JEL0407]
MMCPSTSAPSTKTPETLRGRIYPIFYTLTNYVYPIQVWARKSRKRANDESETGFFEIVNRIVKLSRLTKLSDTITDIDTSFKPNSIIIGLTDGLYLVPEDDPETDSSPLPSDLLSSHNADQQLKPQTPSYNYDTLFNILSTHTQLSKTSTQIQKIFTDSTHLLNNQYILANTKQAIQLKKSQISETESKTLQTTIDIQNLRNRIKDLKSQISHRSQTLATITQLHSATTESLHHETTLTQELNLDLKKTNILRWQITVDLVSELQHSIYPISHDPSDPSTLRISNIRLPTSELLTSPTTFNKVDTEESISTAVGYVVHLVILLADYLDLQLRYPVFMCGSKSCVVDYISVPTGTTTSSHTNNSSNTNNTSNNTYSRASSASRLSSSPKKSPVSGKSGGGGGGDGNERYPLYAPRVNKRKFEYGMFLVNKDIEQIMNRVGVRVVNLRETLGNLKATMEKINEIKRIPAKLTDQLEQPVDTYLHPPSISRSTSAPSTAHSYPISPPSVYSQSTSTNFTEDSQRSVQVHQFTRKSSGRRSPVRFSVGEGEEGGDG